MVLKQSHRRDLTAVARGEPTRITRWGFLRGSGSARLGLSQKGGLPSSGERCHLVQGRRRARKAPIEGPPDGADTSEPPNASPIPHHRSGFNRHAAYDIPCSVPALANANDPNMDDQPKTRLICRRCGARMKLARQLPWLDHRLPAVLLFQCIDCGHVDMIEWRSPPVKRRRETPDCLEPCLLLGCAKPTARRALYPNGG